MTNRTKIKEAADNLLNVLVEETDVDRYQPIRDRVLIKPLEEPDQTESGLYVVEKNSKKWRALVISCGPGILTKKGRVSPDVEPGDVIITGHMIGEILELGHEEFRLIRAPDILGVIR